MGRWIAACVGIGVAVVSLEAQSGSAPAKKVEKIDPVAVVGCLQEPKPSEWMLVQASDPVTSNPNAPTRKELASLPKVGKRTFQLLGVSIFNLAAHRGQMVVVKGLPIRAAPADRLNVTSVTPLGSACE
jgi:hypothetical protein